MSGYPTEDKVAELRLALRELRDSDESLRSLERYFQECKTNLPAARDRSAQAMRSVMDLLREMDCASTGNHGWENRLATLLTRLTTLTSLTTDSNFKEQG